VGSIFGCIAP